jgi:hypothetical protein
MVGNRSRKRGAYFLANDAILDLAIAFLNSFRRHNPKLPLCLIPYGGPVSRLRKLSRKYRFSVYSDARVLRQCDRISSRLHGRRVGEYRRLAMWEGEFDEFFCIDVDSVVLENVDFVFTFLPHYDFIVSQSGIPENMKYVWRKSILGTGALTEGQIRFSGSMGFIASRKQALGISEARGKLARAIALSRHMALEKTDQPFMNYLIVTSNLRYGSLAMIAAQNPDLGIPVEKWAGGRLGAGGAKTLFVHWAGLWQRGIHRANPLWKYYRDLP